MSSHIIDGKFQSNKYPTCPPGKVPLSVEDPMAQNLLWEYAQRRREVDSEFSIDLETALLDAGFEPPGERFIPVLAERAIRKLIRDELGQIALERAGSEPKL
jgi:hypothetical protein